MSPPPADGAAARADVVAAAPVRAPGARSRAGRPRLRVAAARADRRSVLSVLGSVLLVLVFLSVFGVVVFQALLVQTQTRIDDLERKVTTEEERARDLRLELAELRSPDRIVAAARDRLGMIEPDEVLYLQHADDDDAAGALDPGATSPTAASAAAGGAG